MARPVLLAPFLFTLLFVPACAEQAAYINPSAESLQRSGGSREDKIDVRIKPLYTAGFQSDERDKYQFDFSAHFTAIQVTIQNRTQNAVEWNPSGSLLKKGETSFEPFNEENAINYYRKGEVETGSIVLLERPYEQQREEIDIIKKNMVRPGLISPGQEIQGLLLFKRFSAEKCEKLLLSIGGLKLDQEERSVTFPLECKEN